MEELAGPERDFRAERPRDYFRSPLRKAAGAAIRQARLDLKAAGRRAGRRSSGALGHPPRVPRGPDGLHLVDPAPQRPRGGVPLLQGRCRGPWRGRALRRGRGKALPPRRDLAPAGRASCILLCTRPTRSAPTSRGGPGGDPFHLGETHQIGRVTGRVTRARSHRSTTEGSYRERGPDHQLQPRLLRVAWE